MSKLGKVAKLARHWVWIAPIVLGIAFIVGGGYMVVEGRSAHNDVRDTVAQEQITVSADAPALRWRGDRLGRQGAGAVRRDPGAHVEGHRWVSVRAVGLVRPPQRHVHPTQRHVHDSGGRHDPGQDAGRDGREG